MNPLHPQQNDFFDIKGLLDAMQNSAAARGATEPDWNDAWRAMLRDPHCAALLAVRSINKNSLSNEIAFITHFRPADFLNPEKRSAILSNKEIYEIWKMTVADLRVRKALIGQNNDDDLTAAARHVVTDYTLESLSKAEFEKHNITDLNPNLSPEERDAQREKLDARTELKDQLISQAVNHAMNSLGERIMLSESMDNTAQDAMLSEIYSVMLNILTIKGPTLVAASAEQKSPLKILSRLSSHPLRPASALDAINAALGAMPPLYKTLLHRAGMPAPQDADITDPLGETLPGQTTQTLMLAAYQYASSENAVSLAPRHIAHVLLNHPDVQLHLSKLKVGNLADLADKFDILSTPEDESEKEKPTIRKHTTIPADMVTLADTLDAAYKKDKRIPDLLLHLIRGDKTVDKAINRAGLTRKMLKEWPTQYDKKLKVLDKLKEAQKKRGETTISAHEFESLVSEYCVDFTALARKKKFDPMIGNEDLVQQVTTILTKRGKKNPILIGEAGAGKTKTLEAVACAIISGKDIPERLIGSRLLTLDLHQINDTPFVGVFEGRILPLVKYVAAHNAKGDKPPILLGIDEFAEAQNAGGHAHSPGFKGLIKPYLTNGDIFLIAATTEDEYRTKVEKDAALSRRLQPVTVYTPDDAKTAQILLGLRGKYAAHHKIRIAPAMMGDIAKLAGRYIQTVNQPDKSIDLLDHACAIAQREKSLSLRRDHVLEALSSKSNIPASFLRESDRERYSKLEENLATRVLGQDNAVRAVAGALKRAKAGFADPNKPLGNFLFVGPTGVGKTELCKALAEFLFGNEDDFMVRFDMSEYAERNAANRLIGAPPGYVGYDEGGELVKKLRSKPFAVYLYDEVEKAHPDVFNTLLAPFSDGKLTDGRGIKGDMRNAINIMTSNLGAQEVAAMGHKLGLDPMKDHAAWQKMAAPICKHAVETFFRPEFINRLDAVIYFDSLRPETLQVLVARHESRTAHVLESIYGLKLSIAPEFRKVAVDIGADIRYGARPLARAWKNIVETPLSAWLLAQKQKTLRAANALTITLPPQADSAIGRTDYIAAFESALTIDPAASLHDIGRKIVAEQDNKPIPEIQPGFSLHKL